MAKDRGRRLGEFEHGRDPSGTEDAIYLAEAVGGGFQIPKAEGDGHG